MRTYEKTHPWLKFTLEPARLSHLTWMLLGEARSKCDHLAGVPLRPSTADELHKIYLAKGALATTAIEGNTLSEEEVRRHIDGKLFLPPSKEYLGREIGNVVTACNGIWNDIRAGKDFELTPQVIRDFNLAVLKDLEVAEEVVPGHLRKHSVGVATYRGAPAEDLEILLQRMCEWLRGPQFQANKEQGVVPRLLAATLAHLYLAWIHPFGDGNGRTARLVEFAILAAAGVPMPAAHLLSNHYNETRTAYYRQLDFASKSGGDVVPFIHYAAQGFVDGLSVQIELVRRQQLEVAWENYVHTAFGGKRSEVEKRRCRLVLAISSSPTPLTIVEVGTLPLVASEYRTKTPRTLGRDCIELMRQGLLVFEDTKIRARKETIEAFLPMRKTVVE